MTNTHRPITSKARGICKYYTTDRGCFNANTCKFLHTSEPASDPSSSRGPALTPYDKAKRCKYFEEGYCKRGDKCWFIHETKGGASAQAEDDDDEELCSVCFEKPSLYGLLGGCNHIFCIECIRKWRDPAGKGGDVTNIKKCPMCRAACRYIIPSSRFCKDGPEKSRIVQNYKDSMARVPCKHFTATKAKSPKKPMCPFGKDCFYQHLNDDGTPYTFTDGADVSMRIWARRRFAHRHPFGFFPEVFDPMFFTTGEGAGLAGSIAMNMFDRMMTEVIESNATRGGLEGGPGGMQFRVHGQVGMTESLERARSEMVSDAVNAIRAQMAAGPGGGGGGGGGGPGSGSGPGPGRRTHPRPVIIPETMAPPPVWDLEGEGDGTDNGWGWNELVAEAVYNPDVDMTERLELLADNMLGSLRIVRGRDTESPPPPLEPINNPRPDTPPPPLEPIGGTQQESDDDMPALQSVSNSSDGGISESDGDSDAESDRYSDYDPPDDLPPVERAFDLAYRSIQELVENQQPPPPRPEPTEARPRFSTVVERQHEERDEEEMPGSEEIEPPAEQTAFAAPSQGPSVASSSGDHEVHTTASVLPLLIIAESPVASPSEPTPDPPFVTDGRGRVVWSNKDATETPGTRDESSEEDPQAVPSSTSRLFEWMSGFF
ncbi:hypothetical protein DXG01_005122 [Tephrocybe rancida]|nr:hypothetical protein DXG01_005122 [Tephrocybe rancida]